MSRFFVRHIGTDRTEIVRWISFLIQFSELTSLSSRVSIGRATATSSYLYIYIVLPYPVYCIIVPLHTSGKNETEMAAKYGRANPRISL